MSNLLLTGVPGVGKTTIVRRVAERLGDISLAGMFTEEIRRKGQRVGFRIESLDGVGETMAHVDIRSGHRVGRYRVDVGAIDRMVGRTLNEPGAVVVLIDEIGKMECFSHQFVEAVTRLLDGSIPVIATIALRGEGFIARVKERPDAELWEVSARIRDAMPQHVIEWVHDAVG